MSKSNELREGDIFEQGGARFIITAFVLTEASVPVVEVTAFDAMGCIVETSAYATEAIYKMTFIKNIMDI